MKTMILSLLLTCYSLPSVFGMTGTPNEIFRPLSKDAVEQVMNKKITKVADLDLETLLNELDQVEWKMSNRGFFIGSESGRTSSIYLVEKKMVIMNGQMLKSLVGQPVHVPAWLLHEAMGALGYEDENYSLSASLAFLAGTDLSNEEALSYVRDNFSPSKLKRLTKNKVYTLAGGSTVVGGGGDAVLIELKQILLKHYLKKSRDHAGFNRIINLQMEFNSNVPDNLNFNLSLDQGKLLVGLGGQLYPKFLFQESLLNQILEMLEI